MKFIMVMGKDEERLFETFKFGIPIKDVFALNYYDRIKSNLSSESIIWWGLLLKDKGIRKVIYLF